MASTVFRATGFNTNGDLELAALHLYAGLNRADSGATITSSHPPVSGSLNNLADTDLGSVCRFAAEHVNSPGFYVQWNLPTAQDATHIRLAAGGLAGGDTRTIRLGIPSGTTFRTWEGLTANSRNNWYAEGGSKFALRTPLVPDQVEFNNTTLSCPFPTNVTPGDYLMAFVFHRSALTIPLGWSVVSTVGPVTNDLGTNQWETVLGRVATESDAGASVTVVQAASGRLGVGVVAIDTRGAPVTTTVQTASAQGQTSVYIDAIPVVTPNNGVAICSATMLAIPASLNPWTFQPAPPATTPLFGDVTGSERRLVAAVSVTGGQNFAPRFIAPPTTDDGNGAITKISVTAVSDATSTVPTESAVLRKTRGLPLLQVLSSPTAPQGVVGMIDPGTPRRVRDIEFGGSYKIYGTVARKNTPDNTPLRRRVRLHRSRDGMLIRETWSNTDGSYEFTEINGSYEYDVIAWDNEMSFRSVVANNLIPEAM